MDTPTDWPDDAIVVSGEAGARLYDVFLDCIELDAALKQAENEGVACTNSA